MHIYDVLMPYFVQSVQILCKSYASIDRVVPITTFSVINSTIAGDNDTFCRCCLDKWLDM
jgi:hypothetical protein